MNTTVGEPIASYSFKYFGSGEVTSQLFAETVVVRYRLTQKSGEGTVQLAALLPHPHKLVYINPEVRNVCLTGLFCAAIAIAGAIFLPAIANDYAAVGFGIASAVIFGVLWYVPFRLTNWQFTNSQYQNIFTVVSRQSDLAAAEAFVAAVIAQINAIHDAKPSSQTQA